MDYKKNISNRGLTLIEIVVTLVVLALALAIAYPMFNLFNSMSVSQLEQHGQRSDVMAVTNYLNQDVHYAQSLTAVNEKTLEIIDRNGSQIQYKLVSDAGDTYLIRDTASSKQAFKEIESFTYSFDYIDLVCVKLYTNNTEVPFSEFKISRWDYQVAASKEEHFIAKENIFVFSSSFSFSGGYINGPNATLFVRGGLTTKDLNGGNFSNVKNIFIDGDLFLDGGSAGLGLTDNKGIIIVNGDLTLWSGTRKVYGDVYVSGNFKLKDAIIYGNVYVQGNLELGWTPQVYGRIEYTGTLTRPNSYPSQILSKCYKSSTVETVEFPQYQIPSLRSDEWYRNNGYYSGGVLIDNMKIYANSYSSNDWRDSSNVIIVSKGDITLSGWRDISGILFAPNGKVTFSGASFTGVVIAKNGFYVTSGGSKLNALNITDVLSNPNDYPFGGVP